MANIVYDKQSIEMLKQALANTKSERAITPTVAMATTSILHQTDAQLQQLPEEEVWGKGGVVHLALDSVFEVAKDLGYKAPRSELKQAYEMVDQMMNEQREGPESQEMPQESQEPTQQPGLMGAMPEGM